MCVCARQACVRCSFHQIFGFFAKGQWVSSCFFGLGVVFVCSSLRVRAASGRFPGPVSPSSLESLGNETEPVKPNTAHCILSCSFLQTTRRSTVCCSSTVSAFCFLFCFFISFLPSTMLCLPILLYPHLWGEQRASRFRREAGSVKLFHPLLLFLHHILWFSYRPSALCLPVFLHIENEPGFTSHVSFFLLLCAEIF